MSFPPPQGIKREVDLAYSKEEAMVNDALMKAMSVPRDMYQRHFAPHAPRHGFVKQEPTIHGVLGSTRVPGPADRMDYSGSYGSYTGTERPGLGHI